MTFREMTVEDLEQVVEIENRLFSDPWTKEGFFTFLTKENTMFFVIEEKEKIIHTLRTVPYKKRHEVSQFRAYSNNANSYPNKRSIC